MSYYEELMQIYDALPEEKQDRLLEMTEKLLAAQEASETTTTTEEAREA